MSDLFAALNRRHRPQTLSQPQAVLRGAPLRSDRRLDDALAEWRHLVLEQQLDRLNGIPVLVPRCFLFLNGFESRIDVRERPAGELVVAADRALGGHRHSTARLPVRGRYRTYILIGGPVETKSPGRVVAHGRG
jgi:hypothetical protein